MKPGFQTTEFWLTAVTNIVAAIIAILAFRGLVSNEEGELWLQLAQVLAAFIAPIVIGIVTAVYTNGRSNLKANQ
jgi:uncharacterized membrane-anchored protein YitT (DUF2179 family)